MTELAFGVALARPWLLLALLLVPLHVASRWRRERVEQVVYPPLQFAGAGLGRSVLLVQLAAEALLLGALVVGVAGPFAVDRLELLDDEGIDLALVLDVSLSMMADDFPPNRLAALRQLAHDFLERNPGHRVAIVVFAKDVYVQSPPTTDRHALEALLDGVAVEMLNQGVSGGTAVGDALLVAAETLAAVRVDGRDQAVVLITDGASNAGIEPVLAGRYLRHLDQRLYAIGIGGIEPIQVRYRGELVGGADDPYLAVLDDAELQALAGAADGRYFRATDVDALEAVFAELSRLESAPLAPRTVASRRPLGQRLALVALPLWALILWLAGVVRRRPYR